MSVLLFPVDEPVSSEIALDHLDQVSFDAIDPDIAELRSPVELESNVFERNPYVQHQFFEHVEREHDAAFAPVVSVETEREPALVIPEGDLVEIDVEEPELDVVRYVGQVLDVHLPPVERLVSGIDMVHFRQIRFEGIVFLVLGKQSDLMSFGNPMIDMILLDEVIEEPPGDVESGSERLVEERFVLGNEETVAEEFVPLVRLIFPEFRQVADLRIGELIHFLGPGGLRIPFPVVVSLVFFPKGILEGSGLIRLSYF